MSESVRVCVCVRELSVTFKEDEHHWSVKEITSNLIIIPPKNQPLNLIFNICPRRKFSVWTLSSRSCCTVALKPVKYVDSVFFKSCIYIFFWSKCVKQTGSGGCCSVGEKKKSPRRWGSTESSVKSFLLLLTVCLRKSYIINDKQITELSPADTSIRCEQEPGGGRRKEEGEGAGKLPAGRKMLTNKEHTSLFSLSFRMRFIQCVCVLIKVKQTRCFWSLL